MNNKLCWRMVFLVLAAFPAFRVQGDDSQPWDRRPQPWRRRDKPVLSSGMTTQAWCKVVCYSPHVIYHRDKFRMWYLGTSTASRSNDIAMGYAESADGIKWTEHAENPVLTAKDVPWGKFIQTPFVLWDDDERAYKLWFVSGDGVRREDGKIIRNDQRLGYATSSDGIRWKVHPKPIFPSGRSPSVIKEGPNRYRMWMNSRPDVEDHVSSSIYQNIYEFTSTDGLLWQRGPEPVVRPSGPARTTVYPFVLKIQDAYYMWYGCHVAGGKFEIFCARSEDGSRWRVNHDQPAFPAAKERERFDGRYTSTPCVVRRPDRYLLYYSARDWQNEYRDGQGRVRRDGSGVYAHIGVAEFTLGGTR